MQHSELEVGARKVASLAITSLYTPCRCGNLTLKASALEMHRTSFFLFSGAHSTWPWSRCWDLGIVRKSWVLDLLSFHKFIFGDRTTLLARSMAWRFEAESWRLVYSDDDCLKGKDAFWLCQSESVFCCAVLVKGFCKIAWKPMHPCVPFDILSLCFI